MIKENYYNIRNKRNMIIIDIQDKYEYSKWHLPNSVNIPYDELVNNYRNYLSKNKIYYIYCKSGKLSKRLVVVLNYLGYNTIMLEG